MKRVVTRRAKALKRAIDRRRSSERLVEHVFENVTIEGSSNLFTLKCTTRCFAYEIPEHLAKHLERQ